MTDDTLWKEVEAARLRLADLLDSLTDDEWETPSLCDGWRIRDVAAHLTLPPTLTTRGWMKELARSGGSFHRMIKNSAIRAARQPTSELTTQLRLHAGSRRLPPAPGAGPDTTLMDVLTHTQDIAIPLHRDIHTPPEAAHTALESLWRLTFPFNPRKHFTGLQFIATDSPFHTGNGPTITGPTTALLLITTHRTAGLPHVTGPGTPQLHTLLT